MYFIKNIHFLIEIFLDFCFSKSKLRVILIKMCSGKFKKQYSVIKNLKICVKATYKRKIFLFFSSYNLSAYNYTKKNPTSVGI